MFHRAMPITLLAALALAGSTPIASFAKAVATFAAAATYPSSDTLRFRTEWDRVILNIVPAQPCSSSTVQVQALWCQPCGSFSHIEWPARGPVTAFFDVSVNRDTSIRGVCPLPIICPQGSFDIGRYAPGSFAVKVDVAIRVHFPDPALDYEQRMHTTLGFVVSADCGPPPPPGGLPFGIGAEIGTRPNLCDTLHVVCPGESIAVRVSGRFPSACYVLRRVELLDPPYFRYPGPHPPIVRVLVDDQGCVTPPCAVNPPAWIHDLKLPSLPPGAYALPLQVYVVTCADTFPNDPPPYEAGVPFTVAARCPPPVTACLTHQWRSSGACSDSLSPTHDATLTMTAHTQEPLAGLEGDIRIERAVGDSLTFSWASAAPPWNDGHGTGRGRIRVKSIAAIGVAGNMSLQWIRTPSGAHFVLLALRGAPIVDALDGAPVLRVAVAEIPNPPVAPQGGGIPPDPWSGPVAAQVVAENFLGADSLGGAVPECVPPPCFKMPIRVDIAVLCRSGGAADCDVNGDGALDVRDLVLMLRCIEGIGTCPPSFASSIDCDGIGTADVSDVLCCGSVSLHGHMPPGGPGRPEPGISAGFGDRVPTAAGLDVPLEISGAGLVGGARLVVAYPGARFDVSGPELVGAPAGWLILHEGGPGQLVIGLLQLNPPAAAPAGAASSGHTADERLTVMVHLVLKPGARADGFIALDTAEFSGVDGVALATNVGHPVQPLGETALGLSAPQPNPFGDRTQFALRLARASHVEISVHDLSGRRVATVFAGLLPAGSRAFSWDGRDASGTRVARGFYFVKLAAEGQASVRKVVWMGVR